MNRVLGDYFETLLYKIFVSIDEHTNIAEVCFNNLLITRVRYLTYEDVVGLTTDIFVIFYFYFYFIYFPFARRQGHYNSFNQ